MNYTNPYLLTNWQIKTQAKIWKMLCDIVKKNPWMEELEMHWITKLSGDYKMSDVTFNKYLKHSIFEYSKINKSLILNKMDIILIKEIIFLINRNSILPKQQKIILKFLLHYLWKTL